MYTCCTPLSLEARHDDDRIRNRAEGARGQAACAPPRDALQQSKERRAHRRGAALRFLRKVDTAVCYVNASTQFTDGAQFGLGAQIIDATQKFHARGPVGLREICTYKWIVFGTGQVRPA